jgi:hypothetical protein
MADPILGYLHLIKDLMNGVAQDLHDTRERVEARHKHIKELIEDLKRGTDE